VAISDGGEKDLKDIRDKKDENDKSAKMPGKRDRTYDPMVQAARSGNRMARARLAERARGVRQ
jgi:hypothetical protein